MREPAPRDQSGRLGAVTVSLDTGCESKDGVQAAEKPKSPWSANGDKVGDKVSVSLEWGDGEKSEYEGSVNRELKYGSSSRTLKSIFQKEKLEPCAT